MVLSGNVNNKDEEADVIDLMDEEQVTELYRSLKELVEEIPGEWSDGAVWSQAAQDAYMDTAWMMVKAGIKEKDVVDALFTLYAVTADCFAGDTYCVE